MKIIDRKAFFERIRKGFGRMNQSQVDALEFLLRSLEADDEIMDSRQAAYMLATTKWETQHTYLPIREHGRGKGYKYGVPVDGKIYYGRGFVQLTWHDNYLTMGKRLNIPLAEDPDLALDPATAYKIMSAGMREGLFTGRRLGEFINSDICNYLAARKIINGMDKADVIAGYARVFNEALNG